MCELLILVIRVLADCDDTNVVVIVCYNFLDLHGAGPAKNFSC